MGEDLRKACARVFAIIDVKGSGSITRKEIMLALRMLNYNPVDSEIEELMEDDDENMNNEYTYQQFVAFVMKKIRLPTVEEQRADLRKALATFDTNHSGLIEKELFIAILTRLGEMQADEAEAISWADVLDVHKDGLLRINEIEELFVNEQDAHGTLNAQKWDSV